MPPINLDTAYTDGGLPWTHFFNGRVLSREDMERDRAAAGVIDRRLGRALGDGVIWGLDVKAADGDSVKQPMVIVGAGLGINRLGQTLSLDAPVPVLLRRPTLADSGAAPAVTAGAFADCSPPQPTVYVTGSGVYLLTMCPASTRRGLALVSGLGNQAAPCNAKEVVSGVMFRLLHVNLTPEELADTAHLRNTVAYRFFFAEGASADDLALDPFGAPPVPPAITNPAQVDCEIPLAVVYWTSTEGVVFVDPWIARRRLSPPAEGGLGAAHDARRRALGEAMVRQLAAQLQSVPAGSRATFKASSMLRYLPPLGMLPLQAAGEPPGTQFTIQTFLDGLALRRDPGSGDYALVLDGARLRLLMSMALLLPPVEIARHEFVWTYYVRENREAARNGKPVRPFVVFASGHAPYLGEARADLGRWDDANYGLL